VRCLTCVTLSLSLHSPHPHSGHRWFLSLLSTVIQMVSCESAGKPVHPTWRSGNCGVSDGPPAHDGAFVDVIH
jgi:hypothetical protein